MGVHERVVRQAQTSRCVAYAGAGISNRCTTRVDVAANLSAASVFQPSHTDSMEMQRGLAHVHVNRVTFVSRLARSIKVPMCGCEKFLEGPPRVS